MLNDVADKYGFRQSREEEREELRRYTARELLDHLGVPRWKIPFITRHMRILKAADLDQIRLFDGVSDLLRTLDETGITLAIVSSDTEANIRRVLGPENVARIHHFACSASLFGKPAKIRRVLKLSGVAPEQTLCIGDELRDAEAARATGTAFAAVTWGYAAPEALARAAPGAMLPDLAAIAQVVERQDGRRAPIRLR